MSDTRILSRGLSALLALVMLGSVARPGAAQGFEVGAGLSRGCVGDSSGFCGDDMGALWALGGGLWATSRWQINLRIGWLTLPSFDYSTPRDERFNLAEDPAARNLPRIDITLRDRSRLLYGAEGLYHFRGANHFGAVLGLGMGEFRNRSKSTCQPAGCEAVMAALRRGGDDGPPRGAGNVTLIAGLSSPAGKRLRVSTGVRLHNLFGEGASTSEAFLTTALRLGRS
jgi:hypothetical protein